MHVGKPQATDYANNILGGQLRQQNHRNQTPCYYLSSSRHTIPSCHPLVLRSHVRRFFFVRKSHTSTRLISIPYFELVATTVTFPTLTTMNPSASTPAGAPTWPAQLASTCRRGLAPAVPEPAVKRPLSSLQLLVGVTVKTGALSTRKTTVHLDRTSGCCDSALTSYCRSGHSVKG